MLLSSFILLFVSIYSKFSHCNLSLVEEIQASHIPVDHPSFSFQPHNETVTFTKILSQIRTGFIIVPLLGIMESIDTSKSFAQERIEDRHRSRDSVGRHCKYHRIIFLTLSCHWPLFSANWPNSSAK